jgi:alpha-L-fucosidase
MVLTSLALLVAGTVIQKSPYDKLAQSPTDDASTYTKRNDSAMRKWRENRFGLFIHWGLFATPAGYWKGQYYEGAAEWIKADANISNEEYEPLIHQFNPAAFDAKQWAKMAKRLGVRYVTFVPKHHEGFCMWDSKFTDYDLTATPYKKDIIGPLSRALKAEGIDFHLYYSIIDWNHPDYRSEIKTDDDLAAMKRYCEYTKHQFAELLTNYPLIKSFWFDGQWEDSWTKHPEFGNDLWNTLKALRPNLIINNRLKVTKDGKVDHNPDGTATGDTDSSFERKLPQGKIPPSDWEAGMTMPNNQWGYHRTWKGHVKTPSEILDMLAYCASMNGNFMLNFGPKPDGTFRSEELEMVDAIGAWMNTHGEAIYGCSHSEFDNPKWGYVSVKPGKGKTKRYFLFVPKSTTGTTVELPMNSARIISARVLGAKPAQASMVAVDSARTSFALPIQRDPLADVIEVITKN